MHSIYHKASRWLLALLPALSLCVLAAPSEADHREFDATLQAPYQGAQAGAARTFTLAFAYARAPTAQTVRWRLDLVAASGRVVRQWRGHSALRRNSLSVTVRWDGRIQGTIAPAGIYRVRLHASARAAASVASPFQSVVQEWEIAVGRMAAPTLPAFRALPHARFDASMASAPATLPYTVYLGNLHSQTAHSDGGGDLAHCTGAQEPQSATLGPADAFQYAMQRGLDFLVASEHNHMYDGSDGTNAAADPALAKALFQSGLAAASSFNAAHPDFLGVYGLEWGVINHGGHLNIFNTDELLGWEVNASGQLIADTLTPKGDYGALYALMRQRGWVGQFNHPATSGQFLLGAVPFGYSADGDQAMALCEVLNTSAFSVNTAETEQRRSTFEGACNKALEAGYHVAFSTDQDNHCANWGASYTNRTGVLIANGTALTQASLIEAIKARRVFATMDKGSQLVLTANGHIMGERFINSGPLTLVTNFASSTGKTVSTVRILEGVPERNGSVSELSRTADTIITPALGEHFYYAKLTQDDGNILWSAPVWVTQVAPIDTIPVDSAEPAAPCE
ncbi:MAG: CehA/McbA family metallohydrolase [Massilia sp.]|nr:CehA/McbA family metallohydrolase [Massilia sp.]